MITFLVGIAIGCLATYGVLFAGAWYATHDPQNTWIDDHTNAGVMDNVITALQYAMLLFIITPLAYLLRPGYLLYLRCTRGRHRKPASEPEPPKERIP